VKKTFTLITILISLSLIGIIFLQVSWIRNMALVRQEQIKFQVAKVVNEVSDELAGYNSDFQISNPRRSWLDGMGWDPITPKTIAGRYSVQDIDHKLRMAFRKNNLSSVSYEFGLASIGLFGNNQFEKISPGFLAVAASEDSANTFKISRGVTSYSGAMGEGLAATEVLTVVVYDLQEVVLRSLGWRIAASIF
jgi:two-component system phosphate regulon sensor histidine kinase PhoR